VSAPVPSCAIWNLLDTQNEEGIPLLSIADWLNFVVEFREMCEDVERLEDRLREANEQVVELKSQLGRAKEAAVAIKARGDRQVAHAARNREGGNSRCDEGATEQRSRAQ
jgi:hypothetical protein